MTQKPSAHMQLCDRGPGAHHGPSHPLGYTPLPVSLTYSRKETRKVTSSIRSRSVSTTSQPLMRISSLSYGDRSINLPSLNSFTKLPSLSFASPFVTCVPIPHVTTGLWLLFVSLSHVACTLIRSFSPPLVCFPAPSTYAPAVATLESVRLYGYTPSSLGFC